MSELKSSARKIRRTRKNAKKSGKMGGLQPATLRSFLSLIFILSEDSIITPTKKPIMPIVDGIDILPGGQPAMYHPIVLHSPRNSACGEEMAAAECAYFSSRWRFWNDADYVYGQPMVVVVCVVVGLFAIGNVFSRYRLAR
jgi:hypothetical protein